MFKSYGIEELLDLIEKSVYCFCLETLAKCVGIHGINITDILYYNKNIRCKLKHW